MSANRDQPTDPKAQGLRPGPETDPDATISGPLVRPDDPDATISGPLVRPDDPDATISGPLVRPDDPDATISGPLVRPDDPDATVSGTMAALMKIGDQDPEDTVKPQPRKDDPETTFNGVFAEFDPDATVSSRPATRRRANPFAPKALPEALQANLAALGGLNPLIAFANPILSAVPQIRSAQTHPAPALLMETLEDLVEAFEAGATNAGAPDAIVEAAIYALCCMADDAAVSSAWGRDWEQAGLLQKVRGESIGGEQFFSLLAEVSKKPQANADLLELMYVCLALGFEGRYRGMEGGQAQLNAVRADLHALVTRHRPPPAGGLSAHWQGAIPGAVPKMATPVRSARTVTGVPWRFAAGAVAAGLALFVGYRVFDKPAPAVVAIEAVAPTVEASKVEASKVEAPKVEAPAAAQVLAPHRMLEQSLADELNGGLVALSEDSGRSVIVLRNPRQFSSGGVEPSPEARAALEKLGAALERVPGTILIRGYSDGMPVHTGHFASNRELSAARAQAAGTALAAKLSDPRRIASEGAGEADPIAPNDTEPNLAKNRRVVIILGPKP